jgi:hypothetical protein
MMKDLVAPVKVTIWKPDTVTYKLALEGLCEKMSTSAASVLLYKRPSAILFDVPEVISHENPIRYVPVRAGVVRVSLF